MYSLMLFSQDKFFENKSIFRSNPDFTGTVYNGKIVLVYGEGGVLMKSSDFGETWSQSLINDSLWIINMINEGNTFYGISEKSIFKSTDNGTTWIINRYNEENLRNIIKIESGIYSLSNNKIYQINEDLSISLKYEINTDTLFTQISGYGNNLFVSSVNGTIMMYNTVTNKIKHYYLSESGLCSDCGEISKLYTISNYVYFYSKPNFYLLNINKGEFKKISSALKTFGAGFGIYNNELFNIFSSYDNYSFNLDSIYYYRHNLTKDLWERVDIGKYDRFIWGINFTNLNYINENTIIAVGKDKLICVSKDAGKTWIVKNSLTKYNALLKIFDKLNGVGAETFRFSTTTDGGVTWLPPKNHYPKYNTDSHSGFKRSAPGAVSKDTLFTIAPQFLSYKIDSNISISYDGANTFKFLSNKNTSYSDVYAYLPVQYFNQYYLIINKYETFLSDNQFHYFSEVRKLEIGDSLTSTYLKDSITDMQFYLFGTLNNQLIALIKDYRDTNNINFKIISIPRDSLGIIQFTTINEIATLNIENAKQLEYLSSGQITNETRLLFNLIDRNKVAGSYKIIGLLFDLESKKLIKLSEELNNFKVAIKFSNVNDKYYLLNMIPEPNGITYELLESENYDSLISTWQPSKERYYLISNLYEDDSLKVVTAIDSRFNLNTSKILYLTNSSGNAVVDKMEHKSYLHISNIYPNPSSGNLFIKLYYPSNLNIYDLKVELYNIFGQKITNYYNYNILEINDYSTNLQININANPGLYLLKLQLGDNYVNQAIIVE